MAALKGTVCKMAVTIQSVQPGSPCEKARVPAGGRLLQINGHEIDDVLDYRFYQNEKKLRLLVEVNGKKRRYTVKKGEYDELGLEFETYLMDSQHACKNKCIFCFIDQLPPGLRKSLYFKDDDSRLSFLFGNYITLTNITEHEVDRIIRLHISPVNISIHTTNPQLRCQMMHNRFAGQALQIFYRLAEAGIKINCQLVLCPGYNDGAELERTLTDLTAYETVQCIAAVPVGLTAYREGLEPLKPFNKQTAGNVVDIMERFGRQCLEKYGERRVFPADEFYLLAEREIPPAEQYGDFLQLENGVGMWALFRKQAQQAFLQLGDELLQEPRTVSVATGEAAYPLIKYVVDTACKKWHNLNVNAYKVKNRFFGGKITVTGLLTGSDLVTELSGKPLGSTLLISETMLRSEGDLFLDDMTLPQLEEKLGVKVTVVANDGFDLVTKLIGDET